MGFESCGSTQKCAKWHAIFSKWEAIYGILMSFKSFSRRFTFVEEIRRKSRGWVLMLEGCLLAVYNPIIFTAENSKFGNNFLSLSRKILTDCSKIVIKLNTMVSSWRIPLKNTIDDFTFMNNKLKKTISCSLCWKQSYPNVTFCWISNRKGLIKCKSLRSAHWLLSFVELFLLLYAVKDTLVAN